jgi:hypothetical protein
MNLVIDETRENIIKALTDSMLPAGIMAMIMAEITNNVVSQANQILMTERAAYYKALEEEKKGKEGEE